MNYLPNAKGGPAPLLPNPGQLTSGATGALMALCMVISVSGVITSKVSDEICSQNILGYMSVNGTVCLIISILFLHISMLRYGTDREWLVISILLVILSAGHAMVCGWGAMVIVQGSNILGVQQCFTCVDSSGTARSSSTACVVGDTCLASSYQTIYLESACPGWNGNDGNISIDCGLAFVCSYEGPYTFAMGASVLAFTLAGTLWTNYVIYCKILVSLIARVIRLYRSK